MRGGWRRTELKLCATLLAFLFSAGCRQDMQDQPKIEPLEANAFFDNGAGSRPFVEDTVARGQLHDDALLYTGKVNGQLADVFPACAAAKQIASQRPRNSANFSSRAM